MTHPGKRQVHGGMATTLTTTSSVYTRGPSAHTYPLSGYLSHTYSGRGGSSADTYGELAVAMLNKS